MQRLSIKVINQQHERFGDVHRFKVRAESGGQSIAFEILCPNHELSEEKLKEINECFANSLRVVKHTGGYFSLEATKEDAQSILNKLSSTNTGIGVRVSDDPLPEFARFVL